MSVHDGHRSRVRERFLKDGLSGMEEHQILELLLFYCIPRRDTNEIAHNLINRFGSLAKVLDAPLRELKKVDGVGDSVATYLKLIKDVSGSYRISAAKHNHPLTSYDACGEYLKPMFDGRKNETVILLCLDAKCMVLDCLVVGEGSINSASVPFRKIVDMALGANATSVVLAHNHPSGLAIPSDEDVQTTKKLAKVLYHVDIILNDHIIVADDDYISMALSNIYRFDNLLEEI